MRFYRFQFHSRMPSNEANRGREQSIVHSELPQSELKLLFFH